MPGYTEHAFWGRRLSGRTVGVCGAHGGDADKACAKAGIDAVRDHLEF